MKRFAHWPLSVASGATSLLNVFLPLFLVRLLSVESVGRYKTFFLYLVVLPNVLGCGALQNGVSYWSGRAASARAVLSQAWLLQLAVALLCLALGLVFREPLRHWLGWNEPETLAFIFACAATLVSGYYEEICIAEGRIGFGAAFSSTFDLLRTVALLATALLTKSLTAIFWAYAAVMAAKSLSGIGGGLRGGRLHASCQREHWATILDYALPVFGGALLLVLVTYSDQLILSRYLSPSQFAFYAIGCLWIPPLMLYEQSVNRVLIPRLARAFSEQKVPEAQALYREAFEELAWVLVPAALGLCVFAEPILTLLFTERFRDSAGYLHWYALSYLLLAIPYDVVPRALGRSRWILAASFFSAAASLGLGLLFTFRYGAYGALAAMLVSDLALKSLGLWFLRARLGWQWGQFVPLRAFARLLAYALVLGAASILTRPFFPSDRQWLLVAGSGVAIAFAALGLPQVGFSFNSLRMKGSA